MECIRIRFVQLTLFILSGVPFFRNCRPIQKGGSLLGSDVSVYAWPGAETPGRDGKSPCVV